MAGPYRMPSATPMLADPSLFPHAYGLAAAGELVLEKAYNPNEARDGGKWTSGAGSSGAAAQDSAKGGKVDSGAAEGEPKHPIGTNVRVAGGPLAGKTGRVVGHTPVPTDDQGGEATGYMVQHDEGHFKGSVTVHPEHEIAPKSEDDSPEAVHQALDHLKSMASQAGYEFKQHKVDGTGPSTVYSFRDKDGNVAAQVDQLHAGKEAGMYLAWAPGANKPPTAHDNPFGAGGAALAMLQGGKAGGDDEGKGADAPDPSAAKSAAPAKGAKSGGGPAVHLHLG